MNRWAIPLIVIIALIFGGVLFLTQGQKQETPDLPPESNTFKPLNGNQTQQQQQAPQQTQNQQAAQPTQQPTPKDLKESYIAVIKTSKGDITVKLRADKAPYTVINFLTKAENDFYKNLTFHRVEDSVIQGGDPLGNGTGGGNMPVEFNDLPFVTGALGVASRGDGKVQNDAQFFITKSDSSWLNGQYTNFGIVTKGMDVVNKIQIGDKILGITVEGL